MCFAKPWNTSQATSNTSEGVCAVTSNQASSDLVDPVFLSDAIAVAAGYMHTCAVVSPGDVCCWGYNEYGQLGTGDNLDRFFPIFLSGLWLGKIHRFALTCHAAAQNSFSFTRSLQSLSQST